MAAVTLQVLRDRVLRAVSMVASDIATATLDAHVNAGLQELDDYLQDSFEDWYRRTIAPDPVLTATPYELPPDFHRLLSLFVFDSGRWHRVERVAAGEEEALLNASASNPWGWGAAWRYRLAGSTGTGDTTGPTTLELLPAPATGYTARIAYQPERPALVDAADTVDYQSTWEEFAVQEAARRIAQDEEADTSRFETALEKQRARILRAVPVRQVTEPPHPPQTGRRGPPRHGYGSTWR